MKNLFKTFLLVGLVISLAACHKDEVLKLSVPVIQSGALITSENLPGGSIKGTMQSGKTYYFDKDIIVNDGDTLLMQSGVTFNCPRRWIKR